MSSRDDRIQDFLDESTENLDQLDRDLVALEKDPNSRELLANVFRVVHTIKGTCGFFGFSKLEGLTHAAEEILSRMRDGQLALDPQIMAVLLATIDAVRRMLVSIKSSRTDGEDDHAGLILQLRTLLERGMAARAAAVPEKSEEPQGKPAQPASSPPPAGEPAQHLTESSIRVDVDLLDKLMNLVGELVLTRNQLLLLTQTRSDRSLSSMSQRLNLITSRLQEDVMRTRLQRIGTLWDKMPRTVRDVALACGKRVRLELDGEGTELDKSIIEAVKDPLMHLLRNSIDHGIETPASRESLGKPVEGCVHVRALHENGQVRIEVRDDGGGIDAGRVRRKAIATGLLSPERADHMTDKEVIELIFLPGFSTAEKVTNVSGRGVGLDVVKTNIEKIGGVVEVESALGQGTTFSLKIPLTLAIIPALIVTTSGERFAIPQVHLLELVRIGPDNDSATIEVIQGTLVYSLRGNLLPIVDLRRELRLDAPGVGPDGKPASGEAENLLVLQAEGRQFGLLVDTIHDTEEIVVKPLGKRLQPLSVFAGATVMGDGRAALILDVFGLAEKAGLQHAAPGRGVAGREDPRAPQAHGRERLLLLKGPGGNLFAVLLRAVERLEDVPLSKFEKLGGRDVLQYRGAILPLVHLGELLEGSCVEPSASLPRDPAPGTPAGAKHVVVCRSGGAGVGIVVDGIVDIVEESFAIQSIGARTCILGSMVINGRVAEIVDLDAIARVANPAAAADPEKESLPAYCHA